MQVLPTQLATLKDGLSSCSGVEHPANLRHEDGEHGAAAAAAPCIVADDRGVDEQQLHSGRQGNCVMTGGVNCDCCS